MKLARWLRHKVADLSPTMALSRNLAKIVILQDSFLSQKPDKIDLSVTEDGSVGYGGTVTAHSTPSQEVSFPHPPQVSDGTLTSEPPPAEVASARLLIQCLGISYQKLPMRFTTQGTRFDGRTLNCGWSPGHLFCNGPVAACIYSNCVDSPG